MGAALQGARNERFRSTSLRLRGGTDAGSAEALKDLRRRRAEMDGDEGQGNDLKAVAKRRAEQARRAGSHTSESLTKSLYRVFASAGNKLGITVCIHEICELTAVCLQGKFRLSPSRGWRHARRWVCL